MRVDKITSEDRPVIHVVITKLDIRSVERGICPIAKSTMTELFL